MEGKHTVHVGMHMHVHVTIYMYMYMYTTRFQPGDVHVHVYTSTLVIIRKGIVGSCRGEGARGMDKKYRLEERRLGRWRWSTVTVMA